jgi:hypothetical protein
LPISDGGDRIYPNTYTSYRKCDHIFDNEKNKSSKDFDFQNSNTILKIGIITTKSKNRFDALYILYFNHLLLLSGA